jgi:hypothetical protein
MDTVITFGGIDRAGASAQMLIYLARKGYAPRDYHVTRTSSGSTQLQVSFDGAHLDRAQLAADIKRLDAAYCIVPGHPQPIK